MRAEAFAAGGTASGRCLCLRGSVVRAAAPLPASGTGVVGDLELWRRSAAPVRGADSTRAVAQGPSGLGDRRARKEMEER